MTIRNHCRTLAKIGCFYLTLYCFVSIIGYLSCKKTAYCPDGYYTSYPHSGPECCQDVAYSTQPVCTRGNVTIRKCDAYGVWKWLFYSALIAVGVVIIVSLIVYYVNKDSSERVATQRGPVLSIELPPTPIIIEIRRVSS